MFCGGLLQKQGLRRIVYEVEDALRGLQFGGVYRRNAVFVWVHAERRGVYYETIIRKSGIEFGIAYMHFIFERPSACNAV